MLVDSMKAAWMIRKTSVQMPMSIMSISSQISQSVQDPLKVGVVLSGGQALFSLDRAKSETRHCHSVEAPGGHNVIAGIYDGIKAWNKDHVETRPIPATHAVSHSPACNSMHSMHRIDTSFVGLNVRK